MQADEKFLREEITKAVRRCKQMGIDKLSDDDITRVQDAAVKHWRRYALRGVEAMVWSIGHAKQNYGKKKSYD